MAFSIAGSVDCYLSLLQQSLCLFCHHCINQCPREQNLQPSLHFIWASSDKTNAYSTIVALTNNHTSKIFNPPSTLFKPPPTKLAPTLQLLHWPTSMQAKSSKVNNNRMKHCYVHPSFCLPTSGLGLTCHQWDVSFVFEACLYHCWPFAVKVCCTRQSPPMRGDSWGPSGRSPLRVTKSSNEGQFLRP